LKETEGTTPTRLRRFIRWLRGSAAALIFAVAGKAGAPPPMDEYVLKAQALVELSPYFKWPDTRDANRSFVIVVVGGSPFGAKLDTYARGRTVQGRKIEVLYAARTAAIPPCDLVFICRSERRSAGEILDWARGRGVLTVADDESLLKKGVMVDLLAEANLLKLYVNPASAAAEKFVISSQLLRLAKIVDNH